MLLVGLLVLLGAGLTSAMFSGSGGGAGDAQSAERLELDDGDQLIADEDNRGAVISLIEFLEAEGTLTPDEAGAVLADAIFTEGPTNLSAGGGSDTILAGAARDFIDAGAGDDAAYGGAGDDTIHLGDGDDISGIDPDSADEDLTRYLEEAIDISAETLEAGDDFIRGGRGNDVIADAYGHNRLAGNQGADIIFAVDADGVTPDHILGGYGNDVMVVDQGDTVETGDGNDRVTIDLDAGFGEGFEVVTITDFDLSRDLLELDAGVVDVVELPDGSGTDVTLDGVPVARLIGVLGITANDLGLVV